MKNFDELLAQDRTFQVAGETFQWRDVRPEVLSSFQPSTNGGDPEAVWKTYDDQIVLFLNESEQQRWRELRLREENPVTIGQLISVLEWLLEEQTGRPTETPSPSAPGRGPTAASSKAA